MLTYHPPEHRLRGYAAGDPDLTARLMVEAHLALCAECNDKVRGLMARTGALPPASADEEVPETLFDRIWEEIEALPNEKRAPETRVIPPQVLAELPPIRRVRWVPMWPKRSRLALLTREPETGAALFLAHYSRNTEFPTHHHVGTEENIILSGGYWNGDVHVETGDWVIGEPGTSHAPRTGTDEECWCLSRTDADGVRMLGWRGWLQPLLGT